MTNTGSTATLTRGLDQPTGSFSILLATVAQMTQTTATLHSGLVARGSFGPRSGEGQDEQNTELAKANRAQAGGSEVTDAAVAADERTVASAGQTGSALVQAQDAGGLAQASNAGAQTGTTSAQQPIVAQIPQAAALPAIAKLILPQAAAPSITIAPVRVSSAPSRNTKTPPDSQNIAAAENTTATAAAVQASQAALESVTVPVVAAAELPTAQTKNEAAESRSEALPVSRSTDSLLAESAALPVKSNLAAESTLPSTAALSADSNATTSAAVNATAAAVLHGGANEAANASTRGETTPASPNQPAPNQTQQTNGSTGSAQNGGTVQSASTAAAPVVAQNLTMAAVLPNNIFLPGLNVVPASGDVAAPVSKNTPASKTADATGSKDTGTTSVQGPSQPSSAQGTTQNAQSGNQSQAHSQSDGSGAQAVPVKAADATTTPVFQTQALAAHSAGQETAAASSAAGSAREAAHADFPAGSVLPGETQSVAAGSINSAKLIQSMNEAGMQVGMRSAEFGDISIRTSVSQLQMTTQISVEHADLGQAISAHIPALQARLGEDLGVHASIEVGQSAAGFSGERGYTAQQQQQQPTVTHLVDTDSATVAEVESPNLRMMAVPVDEDRLDIRA